MSELHFHHMPNYKHLTIEEEEYFHVVMCLRDFAHCLSILDELKGVETMNEIQKAAYRMAIVEYARPFTSAFGTAKNKYKQDTSVVEGKNLWIHGQLIAFRDQVFAHSDLTPRQATIMIGLAKTNIPAPVSLSNEPKLPDIKMVYDLVTQVADELKSKRIALSNKLLAARLDE